VVAVASPRFRFGVVCETSDQGVSYEEDYDVSDGGGEFLGGVGVGGYGEGEYP